MSTESPSTRPVTVFTPTYDRAHCLGDLYASLCRQTCKDFEWLVVDDGSTDGTAALVAGWATEESGFPITYVHKENGGLYSGYTTAFKHIRTELCVCVDSDDYLTDNAIELILQCWQTRGGDEYAGILGLDCTSDGRVIGDTLPNRESINLIDIAVGKYDFKNGDRKNVVRTELYRESVPFDSIPGEKDFNPHFLHLQMSKRYDFLVLNEKLCVVNYQPGGMTATVFKQYVRSPKSFRIMRLMDLSLPGAPMSFYAKKTIHYVSSCVLAKEPCVSQTPHRALAILLYPAGLLFTLFVLLKARGGS